MWLKKHKKEMESLKWPDFLFHWKLVSEKGSYFKGSSWSNGPVTAGPFFQIRGSPLFLNLSFPLHLLGEYN